ncbi:NB-ARC domain-containing protein [Plantactinospora sp. DSM 117369]
MLDALAPSTVSDILSGRRLPRLPRKEFVESFVRACLVVRNCPLREIEKTAAAWLRSWRRLVGTEREYPSEPEARPAKGPCLLPRDPSLFVGRDTETTNVLRHLRAPEPGSRTVLIVGRGGVGKTSLAVRVARLASAEFPDGQLYVDLGGTQGAGMDRSVALTIFLAALGVSRSAAPEDFGERLQIYRALVAHRRLLVVFDNAACAAEIRDLLPTGAGCAALVTSRTSLAGLDGVRVSVGELSIAAALELLEGMIGAGRLDAEPDAARQIVKFCGGLPMAVWVAGARLAAGPHRRLSDLAAALSDERYRLDELTVDDVSIRASVRLSYQSLTPVARHALCLLSLMERMTFASASAALVLDLPIAETNRLLDELIDANLLSVTSGPAGNRYHLHDLVRLFAREQERSKEFAQVCAAANSQVNNQLAAVPYP